jgi:hypothetical protein
VERSIVLVRSMVPSRNNVVIELEIKRGMVMKKSEDLNLYVPAILVLLSDKLMIFHDNTCSSPDGSILISQLLSASVVAAPSISIHHGISKDCSFCVYTVEQVYKFRVDKPSTATKWVETIISTRDEQREKLSKKKISRDVAEGEASSSVRGRTSIAPSVIVKNHPCPFSNNQIELLIAFESLIDSDEIIANCVATAFFDCSPESSPSRQDNKEEEEEGDKNVDHDMSQLLGVSIVPWLLSTSMIPSTIAPQRESHESILSQFFVTNENHTISNDIPPKSLLLQQWIQACVTKEFYRFSPRGIGNPDMNKVDSLSFYTGSITGSFIT